MWTYQFAKDARAPGPETKQPVRLADLDGDGRQEVLVPAGFPPSYRDNQRVNEVYCLSAKGKLLWSYVPRASLSFGGERDEGPWHITDLEVVPETPARKAKSVWLSAVHVTGWTSFVVKLDAKGNERLQFVNSGAIYQLKPFQNATGHYVLAAVVNNEYRKAGLAILGEDQPPSTSPQRAGSSWGCDNCPSARPIRYFLFPRSELNQLVGGPYNTIGGIAVHNNRPQLSVGPRVRVAGGGCSVGMARVEGFANRAHFIPTRTGAMPRRELGRLMLHSQGIRKPEPGARRRG